MYGSARDWRRRGGDGADGPWKDPGACVSWVSER
jgi:hypothetical protein